MKLSSNIMEFLSSDLEANQLLGIQLALGQGASLSDVADAVVEDLWVNEKYRDYDPGFMRLFFGIWIGVDLAYSYESVYLDDDIIILAKESKIGGEGPVLRVIKYYHSKSEPLDYILCDSSYQGEESLRTAIKVALESILYKKYYYPENDV